jgi:hypothetical protein
MASIALSRIARALSVTSAVCAAASVAKASAQSSPIVFALMPPPDWFRDPPSSPEVRPCATAGAEEGGPIAHAPFLYDCASTSERLDTQP